MTRDIGAMSLLHRCFHCHRRIWPWQQQGYQYLTSYHVRRWHWRCRVATFEGILRDDGRVEGKWLP